MRKLILAVTLGGLILMGAQNASAAKDSSLPTVDVQEVSGLLDEIQAQAMENALARSSSEGAQALVFQMNTRGSVLSRARVATLLENIAAAKVPVAIWVGPSGSRLYGLAAQLLAAADVTAMAPGTRIGNMGTPIEAKGVTFNFGKSTELLQGNTLGFADARKTGALKFSGSDEGVPVMKNMIFALDGVVVNGKKLDTVTENVGTNGQIER